MSGHGQSLAIVGFLILVVFQATGGTLREGEQPCNPAIERRRAGGYEAALFAAVSGLRGKSTKLASVIAVVAMRLRFACNHRTRWFEG